jgi:uncharacterized protein YbjT (DUF2867 family)
MKQFSMILAVGAAGNYAGLVVPELAKRGARGRGMVRKKDQVEQARNNGAAEVTVSDLKSLRSLDEALNGIDAVFYIAPAFLPDEAEAGKQMVGAAIRAGVKRFVFSAVIHPVLGIIGHTPKADVENAVLNSEKVAKQFGRIDILVSSAGALDRRQWSSPAYEYNRPATHRLEAQRTRLQLQKEETVQATCRA